MHTLPPVIAHTQGPQQDKPLVDARTPAAPPLAHIKSKDSKRYGATKRKEGSLGLVRLFSLHKLTIAAETGCFPKQVVNQPLTSETSPALLPQLNFPQSKFDSFEITHGSPYVNKPEDRVGKQRDHAHPSREREARNLREKVLSRAIDAQTLQGTIPKSRGGPVHHIRNNTLATPRGTHNAPQLPSVDEGKLASTQAGPSTGKLPLVQEEASSTAQSTSVSAGNSMEVHLDTSTPAVGTGRTMNANEVRPDGASHPSPRKDASVQTVAAPGRTAKVPSVILTPHALPLGRSSVLTSHVRKSSASQSTVIAPTPRPSTEPQTPVRIHPHCSVLLIDVTISEGRDRH